MKWSLYHEKVTFRAVKSENLIIFWQKLQTFSQNLTYLFSKYHFVSRNEKKCSQIHVKIWTSKNWWKYRLLKFLWIESNFYQHILLRECSHCVDNLTLFWGSFFIPNLCILFLHQSSNVENNSYLFVLVL